MVRGTRDKTIFYEREQLFSERRMRGGGGVQGVGSASMLIRADEPIKEHARPRVWVWLRVCLWVYTDCMVVRHAHCRIRRVVSCCCFWEGCWSRRCTFKGKMLPFQDRKINELRVSIKTDRAVVGIYLFVIFSFTLECEKCIFEN